MHRGFQRLPLSVKFLLIGIIPLAFIVYLSFQVYHEKTQKLTLLNGYIKRIDQSATINTLIDYLQKERKISFDLAMKKQGQDDLFKQRPATDSAMRELEKTSIAGYPAYTFLDKLKEVRTAVDKNLVPPDQVMNYYTTAIYRLNTLHVVSPGSEIFLDSVYKDLIAQKLLSELSTSLGIIRSNVYNVLYTKKYMVETLLGTVGVNNIFKTYETEFFQRASPTAVAAYKNTRNNTDLKPTMDYLDTLFKRFTFDSTYTAEEWWTVSDNGANQLAAVQKLVADNIVRGTNEILHKEKASRDRTVLFLVLALLIVIGIVIYAIYSITSSLNAMKRAAEEIAKGAPAPALQVESNDAMGSLAQSILQIDANNKTLADAADAIGKGDFDVPIELRGKDDLLGNALVQMKANLQIQTASGQEKTQLLAQLADKYKTVFYSSPIPKWIYDVDTLKFLEVNEAALSHYGYSVQEFLSMSIKDIRPPEEWDILKKNVEEIKNGEDPEQRLWHHKKKNGEIIVVEVKAYFIDHRERKARMVVINDVTDKIESDAQLKKSHEEFRQLASHLQNIREEERASMAREVHDVLGQQITCIKMDVSWLTKHMKDEDTLVNEKIKSVLELIDHTAITVRKIASELRPSILDDFGLGDALEWQGLEFQKRSGISVKFTSDVSAVIPENIKIGLFRIYQESLTNIARHAQAESVNSSLEVIDSELVLTIADNGKGFDVEAAGKKKTLGLLGMKERTIMLGGKYEITSAPGKGTVVKVRVPLQ